MLINSVDIKMDNEEKKSLTVLAIHFALGVAFICAFGGISNVSVKKDFFFIEQDPRLSFPKLDAQVSSQMLGFICGGIPIILLVLLFIYLYVSKKVTQNLKKLAILFGFFLVATYTSLFATMFFTSVLKITTAFPRPNFFHYCDYQFINDNTAYYNANTAFGQTGNYAYCQGSHLDVQDSRSSFPSGHTSYCFASAISVILFFYFSRLNSPLSYLPLVLAFYVGVSRIQDYYHHTYDVLAGAFLGTVVTLVVWSQLYPTLRLVVKQALWNEEKGEGSGEEDSPRTRLEVMPHNNV